MFTLKFMRFPDENSTKNFQEQSHSVSCNRYSHTQYEDGYIVVTAFKNFSQNDGTDFFIGYDDSSMSFDICYIENQAGKTIATFRNSNKVF